MTLNNCPSRPVSIYFIVFRNSIRRKYFCDL
nr:MAG TPA: hypothetical protein [Caudoviricetes sp.]